MALMNVTIHGCWFRHNRWPRCQPMAADTLGGWHTAAVEQVKKLGSALARQRGEDEQLEVRHLFQRLSLLLQKGNSALLVNRTPEDAISSNVLYTTEIYDTKRYYIV